jgi:GntR family transcriptional regulator, transcriptional repressor for pyruvate dehydrogenase complex
VTINTVADTAASAVRDLLERGRYRTGDRLPPERELATSLGLSRPTLREAIRQLIEAGLLESRRGSGTYVAEVDFDAVFAVRLQLEPYAARIAAVERSEADVRRLAELVSALSTQLEDASAFAATDLEIHRTVAAASGNAVLCDLLDRLTELTRLSRALTSPVEDARRVSLRELRRLVQAVRKRDPVGAGTAMETHIESVRQVAASVTARDRRISVSDSGTRPPG